jgi:hypothetical protein
MYTSGTVNGLHHFDLESLLQKRKLTLAHRIDIGIEGYQKLLRCGASIFGAYGTIALILLHLTLQSCVLIL